MTTTPHSGDAGPDAGQDIEPDGPDEKTMWMVFFMMAVITIIGVTTIVTLVAMDTKGAQNTDNAPPVHTPGGP